MIVDAKIIFPSDDLPTVRPAGVFELRRYGDPFMVKKMGLDSEHIGTSNFQNIALFTPTRGFQGVSTFQHVTYDYLRSTQVEDEFNIIAKMGWLVGKGSPYWFKSDTDLVFGTVLFGGNLCAVEVNSQNEPVTIQFDGRYQEEPAGTSHPIWFYMLKGMRRSEQGKFTHEREPWFIQKCSCVYRRPDENTFGWRTPKGTIYHPVWSPLDYPTNNPNSANILYLACEFVL